VKHGLVRLHHHNFPDVRRKPHLETGVARLKTCPVLLHLTSLAFIVTFDNAAIDPTSRSREGVSGVTPLLAKGDLIAMSNNRGATLQSSGDTAQPDDARRIHREAVVVDTHNDLVLSITGPGLGERGTFKHRWLPELRAGGVNVQVCPLYSDPQIPEAHLRQTLRQIAALKREADLNTADLAICRSGGEIDAALDEGKIALVIAMEGALALGPDESLLEIFYELGVRMISFTHMGRTLLADGSGENEAGSRLPRAGVVVLREMDRLGIVFDVSHLGAASVEHVLELSTRPVIASHSAARALRDHHRNLTDEQLRGIAATGGVIGLNLLACFIDPENPTIDRVVDHYEHLAEVVGIEHIGVGPDFIADIYDDLFPAHADLSSEDLDTRLNIDDLHASRHLPNLTAALLRRGFTESDIRLILGENYLRVFRQVMGVPGDATLG
jgi:membrane dipeptidase